MLHFRLVLVALSILSQMTLPSLSQVVASENSKERVEAVRYWEELVKARGGREKLRSIKNVLLTKGKDFPKVQSEFYVYPNRFWKWSQGKIVYDYLDVTMANVDSGVFLIANREGLKERKQFAPVVGGANYRDGWLTDACIFFLETRWLKPTPLRVNRKNIGKDRLDVLETILPDLVTLKNWRLDYYIEPETLIVRGAALYPKPGDIPEYYSFSEYVPVDGVMVPKAFVVLLGISEPKKSSLIPLTFQFNVDYDEKLFEQAPSVDAGPNAWKRKP